MEIIPQPSLFDGTNTPGIYAIYHKPTGRIYIGSAVSINTRWNCHRSHLKTGIHGNAYLQRTYDKYGEDSFEFRVIETVPDVNNLLAREQFWIDKYDACNRAKGFNICPTAGSHLGKKLTPEQCAAISARTKGRKHREESKRKMSQTVKGNRRGVGNLSKPWKLNAEKVQEIFQRVANGERTLAVANNVGVSDATVNRVLKRLIWAHVPIPEETVQKIQVRPKRARGSAHFRSKLSDEQVREIRHRSANGETNVAICKDYGITESLVSAVKYKRVYKHVI